MSRSFSIRLVVLLIAASLAAGRSVAQEIPSDDDVRNALLAPLPVRDQFLLGNGFFSFEPESARVLPANAWIVDVHLADSNTFAKSAWLSRSLEGVDTRTRALQTLAESRYALSSSLFLVDGETQRLTLAMRHGFGDNLEIGVAVPVSTIGGGWSDGLIESVHNTLGIGNDVRGAMPRNTETIYFRRGEQTFVRERKTGAELGDIAVTAKYELTGFEDHHVAMSVEGAVKLPTGKAQTLDGSGSLDAGLQVMLARDLGRSRLFASVAVLRLGPNQPLGTRSQFVFSDTVGASHRIANRTSATLQLSVSESPFRNMGMAEFNRRSCQLTAGLQHLFGQRTTVYAGFIENLFNYANSADAGLEWGISRRF